MTSRRLFGKGRLFPKVGLVAALATAMTVTVSVLGDDATPLGPGPANAAALLRQAAAATTAQDPQPLPDQYLYVEHKDVIWAFGLGKKGTVGYEVKQEVLRESWIPAADPAKSLTRSTFGEEGVVSGRMPRRAMAPGTVEYQRAGQCATDVAPPRPRIAADPVRLLATIREEAQKKVRAEHPAFTGDQAARQVEQTVVMELLARVQNPFATSQTRAAGFGALAELPGTTMTPGLVDLVGRQGMGVSIRYEGADGREREELIFEAKTHRFLGWRSWFELKQADGSTKETMRSGTAVLSTKVVDSAPSIPKKAATPTFC